MSNPPQHGGQMELDGESGGTGRLRCGFDAAIIGLGLARLYRRGTGSRAQCRPIRNANAAAITPRIGMAGEIHAPSLWLSMSYTHSLRSCPLFVVFSLGSVSSVTRRVLMREESKEPQRDSLLIISLLPPQRHVHHRVRERRIRVEWVWDGGLGARPVGEPRIVVRATGHTTMGGCRR